MAMLAPESSRENIVQYEPREMKVPFTGEEIGDAAKKLKNGKSAGPNEIQLELIKCTTIGIRSNSRNLQ